MEMGRVVQIGFAETWRWRLQGPAGAINDHRNWWLHLVAQVARVSRPGLDMPGDPAPYTDLIDVAGFPSAAPSIAKPLSGGSSEIVWMLALMTLLLAEWTSRRLRGAK
jgi:hypothetical protein